VIDVNSLPQDGCRKFYTTQFLRESEEGGELEVKFFKKLDEQLNKFNTFSKDKLDEMKHEASLLNKQMDAFIAWRIKVESPGFDDSCAKKSCDTGVVTTNPLKSCSPSRDTPSGFRYGKIKRVICQLSCKASIWPFICWIRSKKPWRDQKNGPRMVVAVLSWLQRRRSYKQRIFLLAEFMKFLIFLTP